MLRSALFMAGIILWVLGQESFGTLAHWVAAR
jgi:hypothetical protein